ncbi:hypothetical protein GCM10020255_053500 [Rhodococcus baikonurensis]
MDVWKAATERQRTHGDVLTLAAGQPSTPAPAPVLRATREILGTELLGYTETFGILPLREAIARYHSERSGIVVDAEDVVVTTGSSGAFTLLFLAAFDEGTPLWLLAPAIPRTAIPLPLSAATSSNSTAGRQPGTSRPWTCWRLCRRRLPV